MTRAAQMTSERARSLGISKTTYYRLRADGLEHQAAIDEARRIAEAGPRARYGNVHDHSCSAAAVLHKWRRPPA